jgi:hypothetical protein
MQFPLSAISLRFAARIPPQSGLIEIFFYLFLYFGALKIQLRIVVIKTSFVKVLNFDKAVAFIFILWKTKPLLNI